MEVRLDPRDDKLARFANSLGSLGEGAATRAIVRALNHEGDKGRTQVQRALAKATGLRYRDISAAIKRVRARPGSLAYRLEFDGRETNLSAFNARQTKLGVSAAPWGVRRVFPHTFTVGKFGGRVFKRTGEASDQARYKLMDYGHKGHGRFPIRQVFGPNLAREVLKDQPLDAWKVSTQDVVDRIAHEVEREQVAAMTGLPIGNWAG